jgi:hypothetical protein
MEGKSKNRRKYSTPPIPVNRNAALQKKRMEIATSLPMAAGQFCLLSCWLKVEIWAFPSGFPISF